MAEQAAFVGQPVRVMMPSASDEERFGPHFDPNIKQAIMATGQWSDGLFQCCDEFEIACLSFCCPCFVMYRTLQRIGRLGDLTAGVYIALWLGLYLFSSIANFIPPTVSRTYIDGHEFHTTIWTYLTGLGFWLLLFVAIRRIRSKLHVREDDVLTFVKTVSCPACCLCCSCCFIAQVARHVDRLQGFLPTRTTVLLAPVQVQGYPVAAQAAQVQPAMQVLVATPGLAPSAPPPSFQGQV